MNLRKFLAGWQFRTRTPTFETGAEIDAYVTGYDTTGRVRIGDSVLAVDVDPSLVDARIRLRVTSFDADSKTGRGELLEVLDEPSTL
ncbi:DUF7513 family protein [Haloferacaceae archaeon DSL9]